MKQREKDWKTPSLNLVTKNRKEQKIIWFNCHIESKICTENDWTCKLNYTV